MILRFVHELAGLTLCFFILGFPARAEAARPPVITIYVVSHGWHTGIVVPRRDIPKEFWHGRRDFPGAEFLEFGWGDEGFYRAENPGFLQLIEAAILSRAAVLHVVGFSRPVSEFFPASGIVAIDLDWEGFYNLARFLDESIMKPDEGPVPALGSGLYGRSRFYAARGNYTLFNNCNHWVARGLKTAGLAIDPEDAMTATAVFEQALRLGTVLRNEP